MQGVVLGERQHHCISLQVRENSMFSFFWACANEAWVSVYLVGFDVSAKCLCKAFAIFCTNGVFDLIAVFRLCFVYSFFCQPESRCINHLMF